MSTEELVDIRDNRDLLPDAREALLEELISRGAAEKQTSDFVATPNLIDERRHQRFEDLGEEIRSTFFFWLDWRFWALLVGIWMVAMLYT